MELISYIPGQGKLIDLIEKDGTYIPKYEWPPLSLEFAKVQEEGMKKAMDELLHPLVPNFPSKADCGLGTSWAAK